MDPERIAKFERLLDQQRKASNAYYARNYKITDDMTEEQKQAMQVKVAERKQKYKDRYANNKEHYKQKVKEYQMRKQAEARAQAQQATAPAV